MTLNSLTLPSDIQDDAEPRSGADRVAATDIAVPSVEPPAPEEFIASLAHEISQPLGALLSELHAAKLLLKRDAAESPALDSIQNAARSAERAVETLRLMRELTRDNRVTPHPHADLNATTSDALATMEAEAARVDVTLRLDAADDLPAAAINPRQLEQVVINLVRNATQAIAESPDRPDENQVRVTTFAAGDRVVLRVDDTGSGVDDELAQRVFEPFYTTRSEGAGMGLAICRRIVESHGGTLTCGRNERGGARFDVVLRAADPVRVREAG